MSEEKRISGTIIGFFLFGFAGTQFLQVLWISKAYGADALALVSIVLGGFSPVLSFLSAGQRFSVLAANEFNARDKVTQLAIRTSLLLVVLLSFWFFSEWGGSSWGLGVGTVFAIGLYKIFDSILELLAWFNQKAGRRSGFIFSGVGRLLPIPVSTAASFFFEVSLDVYLWISTCAVLVFLVSGCRVQSIRVEKESLCELSIKEFFSEFKMIVPVGLAAGIESFMVTMPRYYLAAVGTLGEVAVFVLFTQISIVFGMVASARFQSNMTDYARLVKENPQRLFSSLIRSLIFLSSVIAILSVPFFLVPFTWIGLLVGNWILGYERFFAVLPFVACVWYVGGYANNVSAIVRGRSHLLMSAFMMASLSGSVLLAGYFEKIGSLWIAIAALFLGYVGRSGYSFWVLFFSRRRWL